METIKDKIIEFRKMLDDTFSSTEGALRKTLFKNVVYLIIALITGILISRATSLNLDNIVYFPCFFMIAIIAFIDADYFFEEKKFGNKCKIFRYIFLIATLIPFFAMICVVMIVFCPIYFILNKIGEKFHIENTCRNIIAMILKIYMFLVAYIACFYPEFHNFDFIPYIVIIFVIYYFYSVISKLLEKGLIYMHFERYLFVCENKQIMSYFVVVLAIVTGVAGLYISKDSENLTGFIYIIMPLIAFMGCEQIRLIPSRKKEKENKFIKDLFEELLILYEVAMPQVSFNTYSSIKIRIRLSVEPYVIKTQKGYLLYLSGKKNKKKELIISILDSTVKLLNNEYNIYLDTEDNKSEMNRLNGDVQSIMVQIAKYLYKFD